MAIGAKTEKYRLLANGVQFHELGHGALCAALLGLSKVLLRPGLNTIVDHDHFALWSWCGELLLGPRSQIFPASQQEVRSLYEASIHAALANCRKPPASKDEWQEQRRIQDLQPHHAKLLLNESSLVLAYLGFPLLEAVLKRACATYIGFDGQVIAAFSIPSRNGNPRNYDPNGAFRDRQCSSLRDLLFLYSTLVADARQRALIDRFRTHLASLDASHDPFDLLYSWRNQSLHGSANFQTIGGTLLSLSLLISLFEIEHCFEAHRVQTVEHCKWEARSQFKSSRSFYPPY